MWLLAQRAGILFVVQDDVIDEVDRLIACAKCLQERGAYKVYAVATHGIFSDNACELLTESPITQVAFSFFNSIFSSSLWKERC